MRRSVCTRSHQLSLFVRRSAVAEITQSTAIAETSYCFSIEGRAIGPWSYLDRGPRSSGNTFASDMRRLGHFLEPEKMVLRCVLDIFGLRVLPRSPMLIGYARGSFELRLEPREQLRGRTERTRLL